MNSTKHKILLSAIELFNEKDSINVVLQKIANKAGISIGNLTYHFKNKEAILISVFDLLQEEIVHIFYVISLMPTAKEILEIEINLLAFQDKYRFVFLDFVNIVNSNKDLALKFRENISFQIKMIVALLKQGVEIGNYKKEYKKEFERLAKIIWNIYFNRLTREVVLKEKYGLIEFAQDIWLILKPFLTTKGIERYQSIFEKEILQTKNTK